ncbi:MAG: AMP-binding protein, partial [Mycobacterium sp.]
MQDISADSPDDRGLVRHSPKGTVPGAPLSVGEVLDRPCCRHPDQVALVGRSERYTYAQLDAKANRAANALARLGIGPGDRVAASLPNHPDIVIAFLGAMRLGAIWVGLNRALAPPEMAVLLDDSGASVLLTDRPEAPDSWSGRVVTAPGDGAGEWGQLLTAAGSHRPTVEVDPLAPAAIAYTSGTTGQPKGVVHSQHNLVTVGAVNRVHGGWRAVPCQGAVLALTILNLMVLAPLLVFQLDGTCVCLERHDPETIARWVSSEGVQSFSAVPTIVYDLVSSPEVTPDDLGSLGTIGAGGMPLSAELRARYKQRFGKDVLPSYGLTEAPTAVTSTDPRFPLPTGTRGRALPHVVVTILDAQGRV